MGAADAGKQPQRASMNGEPLDVKNRQTMPLKQRLQRAQAEIKDVFMVDGVEFAVFYKSLIGSSRTIRPLGWSSARKPATKSFVFGA